MLTDSMAISETKGFSATTFSKLFWVAPDVYATGAGRANVYLAALNELAAFREKGYSALTPDEIGQFLGDRLRTLASASEANDVRVCLLLAGPYVNEADRAENLCTSLYIAETASGFKAKRAPGAWYVPNAGVNGIVGRMINDEYMQTLIGCGATYMAQAMIGMHRFAASLLHVSSDDANVIAVGSEGYTTISGRVTTLPAPWLL